MGVQYKITVANTTAANVSDLTDTSINPDAQATTTPRQGGFTLHNRINFTNVATSDKKLFSIVGATAATVGRVLRVLEVPERVLVKRVWITGVKDADVPGCAASGDAGGLHENALAGAQIGVGIEQRSKPKSSATYNALSHLDLSLGTPGGVAAGAPFGLINLAAVGSSISGLGFDASQAEKIDSSMTAPELGRVATFQTLGSCGFEGVTQYFPLGGYVYLGMTNIATGSVTNTSNTKASGTFGYLTGTWDIMADCVYVPE